jgi:hypothetical protein
MRGDSHRIIDNKVIKEEQKAEIKEKAISEIGSRLKSS